MPLCNSLILSFLAASDVTLLNSLQLCLNKVKVLSQSPFTSRFSFESRLWFNDENEGCEMLDRGEGGVKWEEDNRTRGQAGGQS